MTSSNNNTPLSAIVASLISAFDSSRQLFHRIRTSAQKKEKQSKSRLLSRKRSDDDDDDDDDAVAQEEQSLHLQLQRAPMQISEAFEVNTGRFGERYRRGDERAKTSLNHTLLVLNTGLTKIISSLLGGNNKNDNTALIRNEARKSLLSLSEKSTRDALMELEGLRTRLESMSSLQLRDASLIARQQHQHQHQQRRRRKRLEEEGKQVTGQSQKDRQTAQRMTAHQSEKGKKKNEQKRSTSGGSSTGLASTKPRAVDKTAIPQQQSISTSKSRKGIGQLQDTHPVWVRSKNSSTIALDTRPIYKRANSSGDNSTTRISSKPQHYSAASRGAAVVEYSSSPNLVLSTEPATPHNPPGQASSSRPRHTDILQQPPIATEHIGNNMQRQHDSININKRLSILSHSSASTKLGEIPQHKWINPWIPPVEVDDDDDDYEDEGTEDMKNGDKQGDGSSKRGLRFWRRLGRNRDHV